MSFTIARYDKFFLGQAGIDLLLFVYLYYSFAFNIKFQQYFKNYLTACFHQ